MFRRSVGLLLHRAGPTGPAVLIGHLGGPFWANRHERGWTIPKGEPEPGEAPLATARREFAEEVGLPPPPGDPVDLGEVRQSGGKVVRAFALAVDGVDLPLGQAVSNTVEIEWPPRSGRRLEIPELDRVEWWPVADARRLLVTAQAEFLDRLPGVERS